MHSQTPSVNFYKAVSLLNPAKLSIVQITSVPSIFCQLKSEMNDFVVFE